MTRPSVGSMRWLSISRRASSASSGLTEIRISAMPSTCTGKIDRGEPCDTSDSMPWLSSNPRTTRASMSDALLNTTVKSFIRFSKLPS